MTSEQQIRKLEKQVETLRNENLRLKGTFKYQIENPRDWQYVQYLRESLLNLEFLYDQLNKDFQLLHTHSLKQQEVLESFDVITHRDRL